jgi:hypothetical protein
MEAIDVRGYCDLPKVFKCLTIPDAFKASAIINAICVAIAIEVRQASGIKGTLWAAMLTCLVSYVIVYTALYKVWDFGGGFLSEPHTEGHAIIEDEGKPKLHMQF